MTAAVRVPANKSETRNRQIQLLARSPARRSLRARRTRYPRREVRNAPYDRNKKIVLLLCDVCALTWTKRRPVTDVSARRWQQPTTRPYPFLTNLCLPSQFEQQAPGAQTHTHTHNDAASTALATKARTRKVSTEFGDLSPRKLERRGRMMTRRK